MSPKADPGIDTPQAAPAPAAPPPPPPAAAAEPKAPKVFVVADGHSITTMRGFLHAGEVVSARDFAPGSKALDILIAAKHVVERK